MPSITAKAIAQKLGLSTASVSVALNGKPGVSPATRERILAAAAELGYPASRAANADSKLLCFLIYVDQAVGIAQESTFYTFVLKGVETAAKELGYRILIRYYYASQNFDSQMSDIVGDLSGLLILGTDMTVARREEIGELIGQVSLPFPIVILDNFIFSAYVDCVGNDNLYGAKSAMSYLIDQGHRRFGYLRARQRITNFDDRENGIRMAFGEHISDPAAGALEIIDVDIAADKAYSDICSWLDRAVLLPDALFAENDVVAAAAIRAFNTRGIRVPQEISVMGFDDIPVCEMVEPTITTVHSFKERLGVEAVELLHRRIAKGENVQAAQASGVVKLSMSTRLVERKSVASKPEAPKTQPG